MALTDPTSGAGYSFGQILPSSHMTTIANQQPNAVDGENGGTYTLGAAAIAITSSHSSPTLALQNDGASPALTALTNSAGVPSISAGSTHATGRAISAATTAGGTALYLDADGAGLALDIADGDVNVADGCTFTFQGSVLPALASRSYTRVQNLHAGREDSANRWSYSDLYLTGTRSGWLNDDITDAGGVLLPISNLISGAVLTGVTAYVDGATVANHGGSPLPATMPVLYVYKVTVGTGAVSLLGSQADTSASLAAYEAVHTIAVTGLSEAILETDRYFAILTGEAGANAAANCLMLHSLVAAFTCTLLTPGG